MKKHILTLFISSWVLLINAQTNAQLNNQYWVYKDRLNQIFTQVGGENGQSQLADQAKRTSCGSAYSQLQNGTEVPVSQNNNYPLTLSFGDAALDQGWLMMVLASEYWILKQEGKDSSHRMKYL